MRDKLFTRTILGLALLVAGCDETPPAGTPAGTPATTPRAGEPAAAVPPAPATAPVDLAGVVHDYGQCYSGCFAEPARATDKETCKLNCQASATAARETLKDAPPQDVLDKRLASLAGCVNACHDDATLSDTNRETCLLTCRDVADVAAGPR
jgi:hypothetical protein